MPRTYVRLNISDDCTGKLITSGEYYDVDSSDNCQDM